ncbi:MAG: hypothetical protein AAGN35_05485 [Bacteroidota bacterium]
MKPISSFIQTALLFTLVILAVSCNRELDPTPDYLDRIFPLDEGGYRIYHVIDTSYESQNFLDARTYFKREEVGGIETDLLDRETRQLWISTSTDTLGTTDAPIYDWGFSELWTTIQDGEYAERIEGNTRYLVLRIPPYVGSTWNGNLFNSGEVQTYNYLSIDTAVTLFGTTYENCVYVEQVPFRQPVPERGGFFLIEHAYEIYAPGIGKIERYSKYYLEQDPFVPVAESRVFHERLVETNLQ